MKFFLFTVCVMMVAFRLQAQDTFKVRFRTESDSVPFKAVELGFNYHFHTCYETKSIKLNLRDGKSITLEKPTDHKLFALGWYYYQDVANAGEMDSYDLQKMNPIIDGFYQYYYRNGKVSRSGFYKTREKSGKWVCWYPNGQKMSEGEYYDGFKIGKWNTWYKNGNIHSGESYIDDIQFIDAIRKDGLFKHLRYYVEDQLPVIKYYEEKELHANKSIWFFPNGQVSSLENWNITLLEIEQWNENGQKIKIDFKNRYAYVNVFPTFDGDLYSFFRHKLHIKNKALKALKQIEVSYKITKEGKLNDIEVIQPEHSEYEANIVNAVQQMEGKWTVAKDHNLPQNVKYDLTLYLN